MIVSARAEGKKASDLESSKLVSLCEVVRVS